MDWTSENSRTPLFSIASNNRADLRSVAAFIEAGAEVMATDGGRQTPLHFATQGSFADLLLNHGANLHAKDAQA